MLFYYYGDSFSLLQILIIYKNKRSCVNGIHFVVAVGEFAPAIQEGAASTQYGKKLQAFLTQEQALPFLFSLVETHQPQSMSFLFKGSRYTHMETLMADLMEKL